MVKYQFPRYSNNQTYSRIFVLECRREHIGEELQRDGEEQFHEGHNNKYSEWYKPQQILRCALQLQRQKY
jgi:hypothetical protein